MQRQCGGGWHGREPTCNGQGGLELRGRDLALAQPVEVLQEVLDAQARFVDVLLEAPQSGLELAHLSAGLRMRPHAGFVDGSLTCEASVKQRLVKMTWDTQRARALGGM
jgi:hypothetical protein